MKHLYSIVQAISMHSGDMGWVHMINWSRTSLPMSSIIMLPESYLNSNGNHIHGSLFVQEKPVSLVWTLTVDVQCITNATLTFTRYASSTPRSVRLTSSICSTRQSIPNNTAVSSHSSFQPRSGIWTVADLSIGERQGRACSCTWMSISVTISLL